MIPFFIMLGITGVLGIAAVINTINKKKVDNFIKTLEWVREDKAPRNFILNMWIDTKLFFIKPKTEINNAKEIIQNHNIKTDEDLASFLRSYFTYSIDPLGGIIDYQFTVKEFYLHKKGDCDDFAWFSAIMLSALGYKAYYVTILDSGITKSHVFCVYIKDNKVFIFDQGITKQVKSEKEIINFYNKEYKANYIAIDIRSINKKESEIGE